MAAHRLKTGGGSAGARMCKRMRLRMRVFPCQFCYFYPNAISLFAQHHSQQRADKLRPKIAPQACTHLREAVVEAWRGVDLSCGGAVALCLMAATRSDKGATACTATSTTQNSQPREMFPRLVVFFCLPVEFDNLVTT